MPKEDNYFRTLNEAELWRRYCGFLDFTVQQFMELQKNLLMDQVDRVANSVLGKKIMGPNKPETVGEFRHLVPITTYDDYEPYLSEKRDDALADKPVFWCHSSGNGGKFKWIPYSQDSLDEITPRFTAAMVLASARRKGEVNISPGVRFMLHMAPRPYSSGSALLNIEEHGFGFRSIPPMEEAEKMEFPDRIAAGFKIAMRDGVEEVYSIASVLVKVGEGIAQQAQKMRFCWATLHPAILFRLSRGLLHSKLEGKPLLPKHLWRVKGVMTVGTDMSTYKDDIEYYWGQKPYEIYGGTEVFPIALNAWNKKWLTFDPYSAFYEFLPETEQQRAKDDPKYRPTTLLLNEIEVGKSYELVITQFHGMPLLRYRLGDVVTVKALSDDEVGIRLPQIMFKCRADEMIHLAGLAKLDEKTVWQALANTGIKAESWTARKEHHEGQAYLAIYLEPKDGCKTTDLDKLIDTQLKDLDPDYRDIGSLLDQQPVRVTLLSSGTFGAYFNQKRKEGADPAHQKPKHVNASDLVIKQLLELSESMAHK